MQLVRKARLPELGRIRMGARDYSNPKKSRSGSTYYPATYLDTWRLTSEFKDILDLAVEKGWGTEVKVWKSPNGDQWELITNKKELDVVIPPCESVSQNHEIWSNNLLERRCDGTSIIAGKPEEIDSPCQCKGLPDYEKCPTVTRCQFILPDLGGNGVWTISSVGATFASEMPFNMQSYEMHSRQGRFIKCRLSMHERTKRSSVTKKTHHFKVANLQPADSRIGICELMTGNIPDSALLLPPRRSKEEIEAAYENLGYGRNIPDATHHKQIDTGSRKLEDNPFHEGGKYGHIKEPSQGQELAIDTEAVDIAEANDDKEGLDLSLIPDCVHHMQSSYQKLFAYIKEQRTVGAILEGMFGVRTQQALTKLIRNEDGEGFDEPTRPQAARYMSYVVSKIVDNEMPLPQPERLHEWLTEQRKQYEKLYVRMGQERDEIEYKAELVLEQDDIPF